MAVCANCGQQGGDSRFCLNCGAGPLDQSDTRAVPVDRRLLIGLIAAAVVAAIAIGVLVFANWSTSSAGGGSPGTGTIAVPTVSTSTSPAAPISAVTIGTPAVESSAPPPRPTGTPGLVSTTAQSATSTADDSVDDTGSVVSYAAAKAADGDPATAWRAGTGDGVGQVLVLTLPRKYLLTSVGLVPGYNKVDAKSGIDRFQQNRRIARVSWLFDDGSSVVQDFNDDRVMQTTQVDVVTATVRIKVESSRPPANTTEPRDFIAISEVSFQGLPT